jgi:hypothetical protein
MRMKTFDMLMVVCVLALVAFLFVGLAKAHAFGQCLRYGAVKDIETRQGISGCIVTTWGGASITVNGEYELFVPESNSYQQVVINCVSKGYGVATALSPPCRGWEPASLGTKYLTCLDPVMECTQGSPEMIGQPCVYDRDCGGCINVCEYVSCGY